MSLAEYYYKAVSNLEQKNSFRLKTVEWLVGNQGRGTGRTYVMALAYLRQVVLNPGGRIWVRDHVGSGDNIIRAIKHMIPLGYLASGSPGDIDSWIMSTVHDPPCDPLKETPDFNKSKEIAEDAIKDVVASVQAAIHLGADAEDIISAVREVLVSEVMEK